MAKDTKLYTICFDKQVGPYNAGERAGFPLEACRRYVEQLEAAHWIDDPPGPGPVVHHLNTEEVAEYIGSINSAEELDILYQQEEEHPDHDGGRDAVLALISERTEQLFAAGGDEAPFVHTNNVANVVEYLTTVDKIEELNEIAAQEMNHPDYEGGRKKVLEEIQARVVQLGGVADDDEDDGEDGDAE